MRITELTTPRSDFLFFPITSPPPLGPPNSSPSTLSFPRPSLPTPVRLRVGPTRAASATAVVSVSAEASFYDLLGIPTTVSIGEIKKAYKKLAMKYHPDVSPPGRVEEQTRMFIRVQEAYETLSDPRLRALYDRDMAKGLHLASFSARSRRLYNNYSDEGVEEKGDWKNRWQSQLSELKRRSATRARKDDLSDEQ